MDSRRIVLPLPSVKPILKLLHASHSGISKTTSLARGLYFWPGMTNDIPQLVSSCLECSRVLPSQPSNPMSTASPSSHFGFPMQHVGLDLFSFGGKDYLICIDHWSGYPIYQLLRSTTSDSVIRCLSSWFNLLGWPSSIRSNGGPQFWGDFNSFWVKYGIRHELSAPYNPKSNGLAEAGVKLVRNILKKCIFSEADPGYMLYEWRNVPRADGYSPSQLMFSRNQQTCLPSLPSQNPPIDLIKASSAKDSANLHSKEDHD